MDSIIHLSNNPCEDCTSTESCENTVECAYKVQTVRPAYWNSKAQAKEFWFKERHQTSPVTFHSPNHGRI
jgi:hypothetical protein